MSLTGLETALHWLAALFYTLATLAGVVLVLRPKQGAERWIIVMLSVALAPHLAALVVRGIELGSFPIASVHDGLSGFSFLTVLITLLVAKRGGVPQVALLTSPLIALLMIVAGLVPPTTAVPEALRSTWLGVHIGLALMGDAALAIAGVVSLVYLVQERRLKQKKLAKSKAGTGLHNLPALEMLDKVTVKLIHFGFPLMTLGLLSGALYGKHVWGYYWTWDPRNTVSLLVWILYALMLQARFMFGWRGRKAAMLTVAGVIAILVAFVGLGLAGVGVHGGRDYVS